MCATEQKVSTVNPHLATSVTTRLPNVERFSNRFPIKNVKLGVFIFSYSYTYRNIAISAMAYFAKVNHKS